MPAALCAYEPIGCGIHNHVFARRNAPHKVGSSLAGLGKPLHMGVRGLGSAMNGRPLVCGFACVVFGLLLPGVHARETVFWCDATEPDLNVFTTRTYEETCINLCVYVPVASPPPNPPPPSPLPPLPPDVDPTDRRQLLQDAAQIGVRKTDIEEPFPDLNIPDVNFQFPYDEVNYPPSGDFQAGFGAIAGVDSPVTMPYCFAPTEYEECVYTMCFQGVSTDSSQYDPTAVRCYHVEVINDVLTFDGDDVVEDTKVSQKLNPAEGLTFSAYVFPVCTNGSGFNQSVLYFGSTRDLASSATQATDTGYDVRNGIKWAVGEGVTAEGGQGQFFYYDCNVGAVASPAQYACDVWHFVAVTIAGTSGTMYVDGVAAGHTLPSSRDLYTYSVTTFNTTTRPDNSVDNSAKGYFRMGQSTVSGEGFFGSLDEVRVYNYAMTESEVFNDMVTRTRLKATASVVDPVRMKLYWTMSHFTGPPSYDDFSPTDTTAIVESKIAIPSMIPCVLGLEHSVGPVDGMCNTKVYGWSFSDSLNSQCSIEGVQGKAVWGDYSTVSCSTPGHLSPRFATVLATNNGLNFTDTYYVGKTVRHLYMESSLYVQGNGGASADHVCQDFTKDSQAVTVSAWSCPKCAPPAGHTESILVDPLASQETC